VQQRVQTHAPGGAHIEMDKIPSNYLNDFDRLALMRTALVPGVLLPSLTRLNPGLTVLAAIGCVALMAAAIVFHISRGEATDSPFNFVVAALALFVAWGSYRK
jgi:hypothetical protein